MSNPSSIRKAIHYTQEALRFDFRDDPKVMQALDLLCEAEHPVLNKLNELTSIEGIASRYHDRECGSMLGGANLVCPICMDSCPSLIGIEADGLPVDHSKDLNICFPCYTKIHNYWKENKPKKICPI